MRTVCVIHHVTAKGGGSKSLIDVLEMLKGTYHVIACIPAEGDGWLKNKIEAAGVRVYEFSTPVPQLPYYSGSNSLLSRSAVSAMLRFTQVKQFVGELLELKPDAIIFNACVTSPISKYLPSDIKKICFVRETFSDTIVSKFFYRTFERYCNGVTFLSEYEMRRAALRKPYTAVIPDCLEPRAITAKSNANGISIPNDRHCFFYMGGMLKIKGLDVLLRAASRLDQRFCLILGGEFDESALALSAIFRHILSPRYVNYMFKLRRAYLKAMKSSCLILPIGYVDDISIPMCAADAVIFPSTAAHQPRPGIEAGAFHKPVIISDYKATAEYFIDGYNCLTFRPGDAEGLARAIELLADNSQKASEIGENNYEMARTRHNYYETEKRLKQFITGCIDTDF